MPMFIPHVLADGVTDTAIPTLPIIVMRISDTYNDAEALLLRPQLMNSSEIDEFVDYATEALKEFRRLAKHELN